VTARELPILKLNEIFAGIWIDVGFALVTLYAIEKMVAAGRRANLLGAAAAVVAIAALLIWRWQYPLTMYGIDPVIPMVLAVLLALFAGVSIAFVLVIGGLTYAAITGAIPPLGVPNIIAAGISSFILLAVPFFIVAGVLMEVTGMAKRLVDLLDAWVSHWRGGLLLTEIVAMYVFSGMSGSKTADMAVVGSVMRQPMRDRGYPARESVAVLAASGAMGETVPPSIAILVLGSITSLSIGALFAAGLLPAAVLAAALMLGVVIRARMVNLPLGERFVLRRAIFRVPMAVPALLVPVIVIGGIVGGVATPTEASSFAVVYGLVAAALVYRSLHLKDLWAILRDASLIGGAVLLILACASLLSHAVILDGLPILVLSLLSHAGGKVGFLIISTVVLIVLGVLLEGLPALVIFAPLLLPIAIKVGVEPLQFGIILIMAMGIGVFAPPVGIGLYQACLIGGSTMSEVIRPSLYYTAFLIVGLAVVIAFPQITLAIPHLLHMR
jgi:tripartite ATP-independent transporter DctM subunit